MPIRLAVIITLLQTDDLAGGGGHGVPVLLLPHLLPAQAKSDLR